MERDFTKKGLGVIGDDGVEENHFRELKNGLRLFFLIFP